MEKMFEEALRLSEKYNLLSFFQKNSKLLHDASGRLDRRTRPMPYCFLSSKAIPTTAFPAAPLPRLADFFPAMYVSST